MLTNTVVVNPDQIQSIQEKLAKLNKKAIKLGINPARIVSQKEYLVKKGNKKIHKVELIIEGEEIKFGNYEFIASLDHTVGENPIVKVIPGKILPEKYQKADCSCDHCGINRNRHNTYIFMDHSGYKQVGGTCLKEFFGIDPTQNLNWFDSFYSVKEESDNNYYESVEDIISYGLAIVEKNGYISKKAAISYNEKVIHGKYIESTGDLILQALNPPVQDFHNRDTIEWCRNISNRAVQLEKEAINMITWGKNYFRQQKGEYAHNMGILLNAYSVKPAYIGFVVSLIGAWQRENTKKTENESNNQFIGKIGDKITVDVNIVKVIPLQGQYGISYMNIMNETQSGNNIIWISSNKTLNEGSTVTLKGTVKKYNERDGKKQTFLTRCKVQ